MIQKSVNKVARGKAGKLFVAAELCRRGYKIEFNTDKDQFFDIQCTNIEGSKKVLLKVHTFLPGGRSCSISDKSEIYHRENFFWVLAGIPGRDNVDDFLFYIIPSKDMFENIKLNHENWLNRYGINGQKHIDNDVRQVVLPPHKNFEGWDVSTFENRWDLIEGKL